MYACVRACTGSCMGACPRVCLHICIVLRVVSVPGVSQPGTTLVLKTTQALARRRGNFPEEKPLPLTAKGAWTKPTSSFSFTFLLLQAPRTARLPCNRIVYLTPPSRNKTTESNIANRCHCGQSSGCRVQMLL